MTKRLIFAVLACRLVLAACEAKTIEWPQLPDGTPPDTEVTTNIPLRVNAKRLDVFSLKLEAANSNATEVAVAVGHDADEDGNLSFEETAFVFGIDCGERYLVNHLTGHVSAVAGDTISINHRYFSPAWNLAKIVKRGSGVVGETVTEIIDNKRFVISIR